MSSLYFVQDIRGTGNNKPTSSLKADLLTYIFCVFNLHKELYIARPSCFPFPLIFSLS